MPENIHAGHRDRFRERFLQQEGRDMHPHELLELLLYYSIPRKDTNPIAHRLLEEFGGSISAVFDAPIQRLEEVAGITHNTAILIKLVPVLAKSYLTDKTDVGTVLQNSDDFGNYFLPRYVGCTNEEVHVICLDNKYRLIHAKRVYEGKVNAVEISIHKIVEYALLNKASGIVIAHNHPNGIAIPSSADIETTMKLAETLTVFHIKLLDHIIVAGDDFVSLADSGILASYLKR
ncbi:MAG TPA: DNA repair protein RadC [Firmicutes bacterium]|nr:DNA repair protein RadC [Bacillota bacterium]